MEDVDVGAPGPRRHARDSPEFSRLVNLSDAVFAIAMTLLVLTLERPEAPADRLARALLDGLPQLVAFLLAFALVANIWWAHHKFVSMLGALEPGLMAMTLVLLGAVALVPFPTNLIGHAPTERAAALPFIGLFVVILLLFLLMLLRAQRASAWHRPMPEGVFPWLVGFFAGSIAGMVLAFVVALWVPVAGLVIAALNGTAVGIVTTTLGPRGFRAYREWV
jgi:uncharacterized membrane protein